jgi:hypothetical protein
MGVIAAAASALVPAAAVASDPAWTLRSLGQPALQLPVSEPVGEHVVAFDAPAGTRQGGDRWYLGRLHFALELDPASGPGLACAGTPSTCSTVSGGM